MGDDFQSLDARLEKDDEGRPESRLQSFVELARKSPALIGIESDSVEWIIAENDPSVRKIRKHRSFRPTLAFTTRESSSRGMSRVAVNDRTPLPTEYADFAKADVRLYAESSAPSLDVLRRVLTAHQFLERVFRTANYNGQVTELTLTHFQMAEADISSELGATTAYKVAQALERIAKTLDARRLTTARIGYAAKVKRPNDGDELTDEGQTQGMAKMVSDGTLNALADISANPADDDQRFIIRIVDLLVCGGFRAGEVLTLPVECWVSESRPGKDSSPEPAKKQSNEGILYAAEKAQDYRVKWLPDQAVELARRAIDDLIRLTLPAREVARWMEAHPGRLICFKDLDPDSLISGPEACSRLGLSDGAYKSWKVFRHGSSACAHYRVGDIETLFLARVSSGPVLTMPSGRTQALSETLILVWVNQFHGNRPPLKFLPQPMGIAMLADKVSPAPSRAHTVQGLLSGTGHTVTSHQFRHWLNTLAANQGISDINLAKWMGRRDLKQNLAYKHGSLAERVKAARELILKGEAHGAVARIMSTMPAADRETFVKSVVETAHATEYGICLHNFAASPCPNHMQCLRKCGDYLRVKGDMAQRRALLDLRELEIVNLQRSQLALTEGYYGAEKWVASTAELIEGIDEALAVDDDASVKDGTELKVFAEKSKLTKLLR